MPVKIVQPPLFGPPRGGLTKVTQQHWAPYSSPGGTYTITIWKRR